MFQDSKRNRWERMLAVERTAQTSCGARLVSMVEVNEGTLAGNREMQCNMESEYQIRRRDQRLIPVNRRETATQCSVKPICPRFPESEKGD